MCGGRLHDILVETSPKSQPLLAATTGVLYCAIQVLRISCEAAECAFACVRKQPEYRFSDLQTALQSVHVVGARAIVVGDGIEAPRFFC